MASQEVRIRIEFIEISAFLERCPDIKSKTSEGKEHARCFHLQRRKEGESMEVGRMEKGSGNKRAEMTNCATRSKRGVRSGEG